jgi:hypothetical protein
MSPAADISGDWAQFTCFTSTASNGQPCCLPSRS